MMIRMTVSFMKKNISILLFLILSVSGNAQIALDEWKFKTGDDPRWASPDFDDTDWATIQANNIYENQGYDYNGYSWYRVRFELLETIRSQSFLKDSLRLFIGRVDDIDATYLNGEKIGGIGTFPDENGSGAEGFYDAIRRYVLAWNHPAIRWGKENVIAIRVYDGGGGGGLWGAHPSVGMVDLIDFVKLNIDKAGFDFSEKGTIKKLLSIENHNNQPVEGTVSIQVIDQKGRPVFSDQKDIFIKSNKIVNEVFGFPKKDNATVIYSFSEKNTKKEIKAQQVTPYILTPPEAPEPQITNPLVFGARPNNDFLWAITATGKRPMIFDAENLPKGLTIDPKTGIITGSVKEKGDYKVRLIATNSRSLSTKTVTIKIGDDIMLTPPLGWNSWNAWGMSVSEERVRQSANGIITSGLVNHGWNYINIDDGWQGKRNESGVLETNEKFPDMKRIGDYLHQMGLKFGIYSSPGPESCGGLPGSLDHEKQDVETWAGWGIDYIKYDWCSYSAYLKSKDKPSTTWTVEEQVAPFKKIADAILETDRDMVFSVANWGMNKVWEWGDQTGGQLWRTTGDIEDSWESLKAIGFSQETAAKYTHPGGWSDPDMLIVGWVGWSDQLHQSRLTPSEQYTHISLWSLLSAPMLIGCDLDQMDAFTYNLLANDEVIAINQDPLGKAATIIYDKNEIMVWSKPLADGRKAIGIFNLADENRMVNLDWKSLGISGVGEVRDAWRQVDLDADDGFEGEVFEHGVVLLVLGE